MRTIFVRLACLLVPCLGVAIGCSGSSSTAGGDGGSPSDSGTPVDGGGGDTGTSDSGHPVDSGNPTDSGGDGGLATCASICANAMGLPCYDMMRCVNNCMAAEASCVSMAVFQQFLNCAQGVTPVCDAMGGINYAGCDNLFAMCVSDGGTTGDGGSDQACQMMGTTTACVSCCSSLHPAGFTAFQNQLLACECSANGGMAVCQTPCATELCAMPPMQPTTGDACDTCVQGSLGVGDGGLGACVSPVIGGCMADPTCNTYLNCISGCP